MCLKKACLLTYYYYYYIYIYIYIYIERERERERLTQLHVTKPLGSPWLEAPRPRLVGAVCAEAGKPGRLRGFSEPGLLFFGGGWGGAGGVGGFWTLGSERVSGLGI